MFSTQIKRRNAATTSKDYAITWSYYNPQLSLQILGPQEADRGDTPYWGNLLLLNRCLFVILFLFYPYPAKLYTYLIPTLQVHLMTERLLFMEFWDKMASQISWDIGIQKQCRPSQTGCQEPKARNIWSSLVSCQTEEIVQYHFHVTYIAGPHLPRGTCPKEHWNPQKSGLLST